MINCTYIVNMITFSAGIFKETFRSLSHISPEVLYPIPNFKALDLNVDLDSSIFPKDKNIVFLSINRYERKKNLPLAIEAFGKYYFVLNCTSFWVVFVCIRSLIVK